MSRMKKSDAILIAEKIKRAQLNDHFDGKSFKPMVPFSSTNAMGKKFDYGSNTSGHIGFRPAGSDAPWQQASTFQAAKSGYGGGVAGFNADHSEGKNPLKNWKPPSSGWHNHDTPEYYMGDRPGGVSEEGWRFSNQQAGDPTTQTFAPPSVGKTWSDMGGMDMYHPSWAGGKRTTDSFADSGSASGNYLAHTPGDELAMDAAMAAATVVPGGAAARGWQLLRAGAGGAKAAATGGKGMQGAKAGWQAAAPATREGARTAAGLQGASTASLSGLQKARQLAPAVLKQEGKLLTHGLGSRYFTDEETREGMLTDPTGTVSDHLYQSLVPQYDSEAGNLENALTMGAPLLGLGLPVRQGLGAIRRANQGREAALDAFRTANAAGGSTRGARRNLASANKNMAGVLRHGDDVRTSHRPFLTTSRAGTYGAAAGTAGIGSGPALLQAQDESLEDRNANMTRAVGEGKRLDPKYVDETRQMFTDSGMNPDEYGVFQQNLDQESDINLLPEGNMRRKVLENYRNAGIESEPPPTPEELKYWEDMERYSRDRMERYRQSREPQAGGKVKGGSAGISRLLQAFARFRKTPVRSTLNTLKAPFKKGNRIKTLGTGTVGYLATNVAGDAELATKRREAAEAARAPKEKKPAESAPKALDTTTKPADSAPKAGGGYRVKDNEGYYHILKGMGVKPNKPNVRFLRDHHRKNVTSVKGRKRVLYSGDQFRLGKPGDLSSVQATYKPARWQSKAKNVAPKPVPKKPAPVKLKEPVDMVRHTPDDRGQRPGIINRKGDKPSPWKNGAEAVRSATGSR